MTLINPDNSPRPHISEQQQPMDGEDPVQLALGRLPRFEGTNPRDVAVYLCKREIAASLEPRGEDSESKVALIGRLRTDLGDEVVLAALQAVSEDLLQKEWRDAWFRYAGLIQTVPWMGTAGVPLMMSIMIAASETWPERKSYVASLGRVFETHGAISEEYWALILDTAERELVRTRESAPTVVPAWYQPILANTVRLLNFPSTSPRIAEILSRELHNVIGCGAGQSAAAFECLTDIFQEPTKLLENESSRQQITETICTWLEIAPPKNCRAMIGDLWLSTSPTRRAPAEYLRKEADTILERFVALAPQRGDDPDFELARQYAAFRELSVLRDEVAKNTNNAPAEVAARALVDRLTDELTSQNRLMRGLALEALFEEAFKEGYSSSRRPSATLSGEGFIKQWPYSDMPYPYLDPRASAWASRNKIADNFPDRWESLAEKLKEMAAGDSDTAVAVTAKDFLTYSAVVERLAGGGIVGLYHKTAAKIAFYLSWFSTSRS